MKRHPWGRGCLAFYSECGLVGARESKPYTPSSAGDWGCKSNFDVDSGMNRDMDIKDGKKGGEKIADTMNDIFEINHRLSFNLWYLTDVKSDPQGFSPRLILPKRRSGEIRISEQESKILYCGLLNTLNYYYSIETPTEEVYQQTGKTSQSASSDLSLYGYDGKDFKKVANVEFKAHNPDKLNIQKA